MASPVGNNGPRNTVTNQTSGNGEAQQANQAQQAGPAQPGGPAPVELRVSNLLVSDEQVESNGDGSDPLQQPTGLYRGEVVSALVRQSESEGSSSASSSGTQQRASRRTSPPPTQGSGRSQDGSLRTGAPAQPPVEGAAGFEDINLEQGGLRADGNGHFAINIEDLSPEAQEAAREIFTGPHPRTQRLKNFIETFILGLDRAGNYTSPLGRLWGRFEALARELYPTYNPIFIFQIKFGSGYSIGQFDGGTGLGGWAQNGLQVNLISRGVNAGDRWPIVQIFPLHAEAGGGALGFNSMLVQNLGMNFVPDEQDRYPSIPQLMYERVVRHEFGRRVGYVPFGPNGEFGAMSINSGFGYDALRQLYWDGTRQVNPENPDEGVEPNRRSWLAGALIAGAEIAAGALGYALFSGFRLNAQVINFLENIISADTNGTANAMLEAVYDNATVIPGQENSTLGSFTGRFNGTQVTDLSMVRGVPTPLNEQNFSHLGGALFAMAAAHTMAEKLEGTTSMRPDFTLSMPEITIDTANFFIDFPVVPGTNMTIGVIPRLVQFTPLRATRGENFPLYANQPHNSRMVEDSNGDEEFQDALQELPPAPESLIPTISTVSGTLPPSPSPQFQPSGAQDDQPVVRRRTPSHLRDNTPIRRTSSSASSSSLSSAVSSASVRSRQAPVMPAPLPTTTPPTPVYPEQTEQRRDTPLPHQPTQSAVESTPAPPAPSNSSSSIPGSNKKRKPLSHRRSTTRPSSSPQTGLLVDGPRQTGVRRHAPLPPQGPQSAQAPQPPRTPPGRERLNFSRPTSTNGVDNAGYETDSSSSSDTE